MSDDAIPLSHREAIQQKAYTGAEALAREIVPIGYVMREFDAGHFRAVITLKVARLLVDVMTATADAHWIADALKADDPMRHKHDQLNCVACQGIYTLGQRSIAERAR